jgi:hypothetical protein
VFVHNAGHGGLRGRNGTEELIQAIRLVESPAKFIIRCQDKKNWPPYSELLGKVELVNRTVPYDELWSEGDVFIFPEKFNGLSLPLQEAYASGMLVMGTNRFPMNTWLHSSPLITPSSYHRTQVSGRCNMFSEAVLDPVTIAAHIDKWYGKPITPYSLQGKEWAEKHSWEVLKPRYMEVL